MRETMDVDVTFPSRGSNGSEYHRVLVKSEVKRPSWLHSVYIEVDWLWLSALGLIYLGNGIGRELNQPT